MNNICFNVQSPSVSISNYHSVYQDANTPPSETPYNHYLAPNLIEGTRHYRFQTNINDYNSPVIITHSVNGKSSNKRVTFESDI